MQLGTVLVATGVFVASTLVSSAVVVAVLVLVAPDHFVRPPIGLGGHIRSWPARVAYVVGKNLLGCVLVSAGVLMSLPGVPGQGILTILVGVVLLDIPGTRRLELRVLRQPRVRRAVDALRARFGRPPLVFELSRSLDVTVPGLPPAGADARGAPTTAAPPAGRADPPAEERPPRP
ncbi:MAG: hypothetical protein HY908_14265 [Myxococcales bacterium]|nr:hypothetical protein [Myxococcales bacterium]